MMHAAIFTPYLAGDEHVLTHVSRFDVAMLKTLWRRPGKDACGHDVERQRTNARPRIPFCRDALGPGLNPCGVLLGSPPATGLTQSRASALLQKIAFVQWGRFSFTGGGLPATRLPRRSGCWRMRLRRLLADILVPQLRLVADEATHHMLAPLIIEHIDLHAARAQQFFFAHERAVFTHDHCANAV